MAVDMKELIAQKTLQLLFDKQVKKLTVKDIVEACHITRQAFYYHFSDIPDLFQWIMQRRTEQLLDDFLKADTPEEKIRRFLLYAVHARPVIKKGMESGYSGELVNLLRKNIHEFFHRAVEQRGIVWNTDDAKQNLIIRYHCHAIMGLLLHWSDEDTKNIDQIAHTVFVLISQTIDL